MNTTQPTPSAPDLTGAAKAAAEEIHAYRWKSGREVPEELAAIILRHCAPAAVGEGARTRIGDNSTSLVAQKPAIMSAGVAGNDGELKQASAQAGEVEQPVSNGKAAGSSPAQGLISPPRPSAERTDGERLDWLDKYAPGHRTERGDGLHWLSINGYEWSGDTLRAAIDSAMSQSPARTGQGGRTQ